MRTLFETALEACLDEELLVTPRPGALARALRLFASAIGLAELARALRGPDPLDADNPFAVGLDRLAVGEERLVAELGARVVALAIVQIPGVANPWVALANLLQTARAQGEPRGAWREELSGRLRALELAASRGAGADEVAGLAGGIAHLVTRVALHRPAVAMAPPPVPTTRPAPPPAAGEEECDG